MLNPGPDEHIKLSGLLSMNWEEWGLDSVAHFMVGEQVQLEQEPILKFSLQLIQRIFVRIYGMKDVSRERFIEETSNFTKCYLMMKRFPIRWHYHIVQLHLDRVVRY